MTNGRPAPCLIGEKWETCPTSPFPRYPVSYLSGVLSALRSSIAASARICKALQESLKPNTTGNDHDDQIRSRHGSILL